MTPEQAAAGLAKLREPFPDAEIGTLPKPTKKNAEKGSCRECGGYHGLPAVHLSYVGHAAVTKRLLEADEAWRWEPDRTPDGRWDIVTVSGEASLTGTLTVCGVTRPCVGIAPAGSFELAKQLQSDAIRNGAMRFGVALDLWSKEDLHAEPAAPEPPAFDPEDPATWPDVLTDSKAKRVVLAALGNREAAGKAWDALPVDQRTDPNFLADWMEDR